ncbi:patched domain-containing protein 3-like [Anneissia japonica]|uniref:patched domain-containing protein 3-like n=1 Tax=Anneissia japonica TaxID=1529436 RepID=UPI001425AA6D|nr:patched domain-containing protein 3-like [Anneissia japonica]XP_033120938.1 patched domain-containing protein 3-like [Anneissia japonica]XP_033120939.1 patched domain-containing protein 3-like [Anneissia japonica]XP_033120940.1 patched domain-containing protein 3-like [Anneissia japonica]XP_033120941.1 patched domain-containing protein 3-like [Anneissia japonica]
MLTNAWLENSCPDWSLLRAQHQKPTVITMKFDCIDKIISGWFGRYGRLLARQPLPFLLLPLFLVFLLLIGFLQFNVEDDVEYLFTPEGSPGKTDRVIARELFKNGDEGTEFLPNRALETFIQRGELIATPKKGNNILSEVTFGEILALDEDIRAIKISINGTEKDYTDLCMKWDGHCLTNPVLEFFDKDTVHLHTRNLTYPNAVKDNEPLFIGKNLGGVTFYNKEEGTVKSAQAMAIHYLLSGSDQDYGKEWEKRFMEFVANVAKTSKTIDICMATSMSLADEMLNASVRVIPRFAATFGMLIVFAILSCIQRDWVLSRPWLGLLGVINAGLAILSSIGMLSFGGIKFNMVVASMPFLILGIGVDNMFLMIASWRQCKQNLCLEERMGRTFSEAAVSISITTLTDLLVFAIGASTKIPSVRMFCAYAGLSVLFMYIYQITFFGACMVYTGQRELKNHHCCSCKKVLPREEAPTRLYRIFCAGGFSSRTRNFNVDLEHRVMKFFRAYYGPFLMKPYVKVFVLLAFIMYFLIGIYGCARVQEGLRLKYIAAEDSYPYKYYDKKDQFFLRYGPSVSIIFTDPLPYWEEKSQAYIEEITRKYEGSEYVCKNFTESWIRVFQKFLYMTLNTTDVEEKVFLSMLEQFLASPQAKRFNLDITFNENRTQIIGSRILVLTNDLHNAVEERNMMLEMRDLAGEASFNITAFDSTFIHYDQYVGVLPTTIQTLGIATASMFIVALLMIPHPVCTIWVTFCIVSIDIAVIGYMTLWGVSLDGISMMNIILCIGFSVDFTAHITYAYVTSPESTPNKRAIDALHSLGMPILQGALSTIIGVSALCTAPMYVFTTFFKTLFLVMVFGALHGLVFLPVFLTVLGPCMPHAAEEHPQSEDVAHSSNDEKKNTYVAMIPVFLDDNKKHVVDAYISVV